MDRKFPRLSSRKEAKKDRMRINFDLSSGYTTGVKNREPLKISKRSIGMQQQIVHLFVLDTLSDWEPVFAISMINKKTYQPFQAHPWRYQVKTVGESKEPVTTAAGLTILPDMTVDELEPAQSAMLILPGADTWLEEPRTPVLERAKAYLATGVPVAAICGAVLGLAHAGALNEKKHTGNSLAEL